jgi:hypothetical protein
MVGLPAGKFLSLIPHIKGLIGIGQIIDRPMPLNFLKAPGPC